MPLHQDQIIGCRHRHHHIEGFASKHAPKHFPPDLRIEPKHQDIDLFVDVENRSVEGTVTHKVVGRTQGATTIVFDALDFTIERVHDPAGRDVSYQYDGKKLTMRWEEGFTQGEEREIAVTYRVDTPISGLFFSTPNETYPEDATYAATDHETERARHWLPCIDLPNVRCTLSFHLRADSDYTILANGALTSEEEHDDGTKTAHWDLDYPCPSYITCFALGKFTRAEDGEFAGIPIAYFGAHTVTEENLIRAFGRTGEMLAWLTEKLGAEFPYPKYYQFALPGFGGAMENISLVSWNEIFILDEGLEKEEWGWLVDQINIHEMAHSYFGDAIVCRDFSHAWLKESWATYTESCWLEFKKGREEIDYDVWRNKTSYFVEADSSYKRPIVTKQFDSSWQMYDRHLYPGGAARLHMLRKFLGDDVFWDGVRTYVARFMGKVVETSDFRRTLEEVSGRSLVQFFDQWIHTAGYPVVKASFSYDGDKKLGTFSLEQTQTGEGKTEPVFVMDVGLSWFDKDGTEHRASVHMDQAKVFFTAVMGEEPEMVRVDPDNELVIKLEFEPGDAKLGKQLTDAVDVPGRIMAAQVLAKSAKKKNLETVWEAYQKEDFWGVRQQMAKAVGKANTRVAMDVLLKMLAHEKDPKVFVSLIQSVQTYQEPEVIEALLAKIDEGLTPRALETAFEALGKQRANAPFERLAEAAAQPTYLDFVQCGALAGLAHSRQTQATEILLHTTHYGNATHRARARAAMLLGGYSRHLPEHAREPIHERLIALLRDPIDTVRLYAAYGLVHGRVSSASGALRAFMQTLSHQDQVEFEPRLAALSSGDEAKVKGLEEKVEELDKKLREITEQFAKLQAENDKKETDKT